MLFVSSKYVNLYYLLFPEDKTTKYWTYFYHCVNKLVLLLLSFGTPKSWKSLLSFERVKENWIVNNNCVIDIVKEHVMADIHVLKLGKNNLSQNSDLFYVLN